MAGVGTGVGHRCVITADGVRTDVVATPMRLAGRDVRHELVEHGWARFGGHELGPRAVGGVQALRRGFAGLPVDPYAQPANRRRRHSRLVYLPWVRCFTEQQGGRYFQRSEHNPVDGGRVREFRGIEPSSLRDPFLLDLIDLDFSLVPFPDNVQMSPVDVGVHMIAYEPTPGNPAISSPNRLHRDGEPYTFVHLIDREDVEGGGNVVAADDGHILAEFMLERALDTFVVRDSAVVHTVHEMRTSSGRPFGRRTIVIVDFTPYERGAGTSW